MVVVWHLFCLSILTLSTGVVAVASSSECDVFGTCSQLCSDTENGSYKCSCLEGFQLGPDNRSCTPIDPQWKLIYTTTFGIHWVSKFSNGTEQTTNLAKRKLATQGLTYDARSNVVYWTEVFSELGTIYKTDMSNKSERKVETVSHIGHGHLRGIAFDWITGNIYFADSASDHIGVCRNDTDECVVIVKTEDPWDLALHPNQGLMFWTDQRGHGIFRAEMDGTFVQQIVFTNVGGHTGIVVDQGNSRIFWTGDWGCLESARLDGSDKQIIISLSPPVAYPYGIDVLGDRIFWCDHKIGHIRSANKFNGSNTVKHDPVAIRLALVHTANQPILRSNPCQRARNCSHICTLSSNATEFKCFCPVGLTLGNDNRTCVEPENGAKLVVAFKDTIQSMRFNAIGKKIVEPISIPKIKSISDLVYNPINHTLILSEVATKTIYEYSLSSKQLNVLTSKDLDVVVGLDIDVVGENLYWIDSGKKSIEVMALKTGARTVIQKGVEHASCLAVVPKMGLLYFAKKDGNGESNIYKTFLNGGTMTVFQRQMEPVSIGFDEVAGRIFWADKANGNLEWIYRDSIGTLLSNHNVTSDVGMYKRKVFWVDMFNQELQYVQLPTYYYKHRPIRVGLPWLKEHSSPSKTANNLMAKITVVNRDYSYLQKNITKHDCSRENTWRKPCSHMCLLTGEEFVGECRCPAGLTLDEDGVNCKETSTCDERNCTFFCSPDFFKCSTLNQCIVPSFVCNGVRDCEDGSDEMTTCNTTCSEEQFTCDSGKCIDLGFACDGLPNCENNEDEADCGLSVPTEWKIDDISTATAKAPELNHENDDDLTPITIVYGSILSIIVFAGVIALVLYTFKKVGTVSEEDRFELLHE